ncbi:heparinase II/III family protein [Calditrichota bacterium LG25]
MLRKIKLIVLYSKNMGPDWALFRLQYELKKQMGYYDRVNKSILSKANKLSSSLFYFSKPGLVNPNYSFKTNKENKIISKAENALNGKIFAFSSAYLDYSDSEGHINWHLNPILKIEAPRNIPWNKLPDFGTYGDIKLIWEASRFPQVFFFINAFSLTKDEKFPIGCLQQIEHWIDNNPFPYGVHYKCGQEISFRLFAWVLALDYFYEFLSSELTRKIVKNIYISLLRIAANVDFAAKSVKNNHSISEAAGLLIGGLLFPQFPDSESFVQKGLKYLQKELTYQVYADGSYIQHSFNYQRLVLDVLSFVLTIAQKMNFSVPSFLKSKHKKLLNFLNAFVQPNGFLPNYGHNDGSLLFPLSTRVYRDFRENLNWAGALQTPALSYFPQNNTLVDFFGLTKGPEKKPETPTRFDAGGYYILRNENFFTFVRCHSYKHRPAHSDMLHLDIWHKDLNIFCDTGTFSYNTDTEFKKNFFGTLGHNTIMLNDSNQMQEILHFGWADWLKSKLLKYASDTFIGEHYGYLKRFKVVHRRQIRLKNNKIQVIDVISGNNQSINIKQIWNSPLTFKQIDDTKFANAVVSIYSSISGRQTKSLISDFYNSYVSGTRIIFETQTTLPFTIETVIKLK